jgi:hypothetical protein
LESGQVGDVRTNIMLEKHYVSADAFLHETAFCESQPRTRELMEKWKRCALSSRHPTVRFKVFDMAEIQQP